MIIHKLYIKFGGHKMPEGKKFEESEAVEKSEDEDDDDEDSDNDDYEEI